MGIISKICVMFLVWMAIGLCTFQAIMTWYAIKAIKSYHRMNHNSVSELYDLTADVLTGGFSRETHSAIKGTFLDNKYVAYFTTYLMWPSAIARVKPALQKAYSMMAKKYNGLDSETEGLS